MRTLKFKIVLDNNLILPLKRVDFRKGEVYRFAPDDREDVKWFYPARDGHKLIQFTGLTDRHGKEIYEGDILASLPTPHLVVDRLLFEAFWQPRLACWAYKSLSTVSPKFYTEHEFMESNLGMNTPPIWYPLEIIGNIYENKELLK